MSVGAATAITGLAILGSVQDPPPCKTVDPLSNWACGTTNVAKVGVDEGTSVLGAGMAVLGGLLVLAGVVASPESPPAPRPAVGLVSAALRSSATERATAVSVAGPPGFHASAGPAALADPQEPDLIVAARAGRCATVQLFARRLRAVDPDRVVALAQRDEDVARCLVSRL